MTDSMIHVHVILYVNLALGNRSIKVVCLAYSATDDPMSPNEQGYPY